RCCRRVCPAEDYPLFEGAMRTETVRCPCVTDEVCAVLALRIGRGTPRKFGCWVWTVVPPRAEHFRTRWSGDIRRERWIPSVAARSAATPTVDDPWKSRFGPKTGRIGPSQHGRNPPIASHGCLDPSDLAHLQPGARGAFRSSARGHDEGSGNRHRRTTARRVLTTIPDTTPPDVPSRSVPATRDTTRGSPRCDVASASSARRRRTHLEPGAEGVRDVREPPVDHVEGFLRGSTAVDSPLCRRIDVGHLEQRRPTGVRGLRVAEDAPDLVTVRSAEEREVRIGHVRIGLLCVVEGRAVEVPRGSWVRGDEVVAQQGVRFVDDLTADVRTGLPQAEGRPGG